MWIIRSHRHDITVFKVKRITTEQKLANSYGGKLRTKFLAHFEFVQR